MQEIDFQEFVRYRFQRPNLGARWNRAVNEEFAYANELMSLYVLRLVEKTEAPEQCWFSAWGNQYKELYTPLFEGLESMDRETIRQQLIRLVPSSIRVLNLFDFVESSLDELFEGRAAEEIFFAPSQLAMWEQYFNTDNDLYQVNNHMIASAVADFLPNGGSICEIGGGMGSAAISLARCLDTQQQQATTLTFTDIVPMFLNRARRALSQWPMEIQYKKYDLNQAPDFGDQKFDVIYTVNALHVSFDLDQSLSWLRSHLNDDGALMLVEATRPDLHTPIYPEFVFGFFRDFSHCKTTPHRPKPGFLDANHWIACLKQNGFQSVDVFPDLKSYESYPFMFSNRFIARL